MLTVSLWLSTALAVSDQQSASDQAREPATRHKAKAVPPAVVHSATPTPAPAAITDTSLRITKIEIKGNKKIETDAITARLVSKIDAPYSAERVRQDVEALFKSGYFYDVRVDRTINGSDATLLYTVVEKPSLAEVHFSGNHEVETDDLKEATGLKPFEILNMSKVHDATEKLQKLYEDKGFFLAKVTTRVEPMIEGDSVKIIFDIQENDKVKVKRITFLGNKNLLDARLKGVMATQEGGFFSFVSGSGAYKQDAFDHDIQVLNYSYFNEGYVQVKIDRPQVYVTPDKKGIYITIRIDEGERFKVGTVDFAGDLLFDKDDLYKSIEINNKEKTNGGWYVHETLLKDLRTLQAKYGDLGYAYANIIPRTRIREKDREIDITFEIDKGNKVYFGRINVVGNSRTRDKVVRRELTVREGELYNETRKRESIENVKRLGYFEEVNFNSKTPTDNQDLMDIDIVVKERNTGTIQVGAGYSTYSQFIFNGQVNQINLFGRGQKLGVQIDLSSNMSNFNINFTEPYFYDSLWSVGGDIYASNRILLAYNEQKTGADLRIGHPLLPYLRGFVRYKFESVEIDLNPVNGDPTIFPTNPSQPWLGYPNGMASTITGSLEYDKRNDRFMPTNGVFASTSLEFAGLGGDIGYTKGSASLRYYKKFLWELVFRNNLSYGFVSANQPNWTPPYNELYLLGGANSLRGYNWYQVGKRKFSQKRYNCWTTGNSQGYPLAPGMPFDASCGALQAQYPNGGPTAVDQSYVPFGGVQEAYYQAEIEFPLISEAGIKGVVFYDIGAANDLLRADQFRQDVGFGFRWLSPIGPLRFEWGFPFNRYYDDPASTFQFAIGSPF